MPTSALLITQSCGRSSLPPQRCHPERRLPLLRVFAKEPATLL